MTVFLSTADVRVRSFVQSYQLLQTFQEAERLPPGPRTHAVSADIPQYGITRVHIVDRFGASSIETYSNRLHRRSPGERPQYLRNAHAFISFYYISSQNFGLSSNIFDKSTPVI